METLNTQTGEVIETASETNIDKIILNLESMKEAESAIRSKRIELETQLVLIAQSIPGGEKTRRVSGKEKCVKITFKTETRWDQKQLEQIRSELGDEMFFSYFAEEYKAKTLELKKLRNTAGEGEKVYFDICKAMTEIQGKPYVEVEK